MSVSETVWFEQVDTALINYIQKRVKVLNSQGVMIPVPVYIRKPDEDFKVEQYPCITLYNLHSSRDEIRYFSGNVVVERDLENNKLIEEQGAIPYNLFYQFEFWSTLQTDMNDMTRLWLGCHPEKYFNLPVHDMSGQERSSFVLMVDDLKKMDFINEEARTFRSVLTYKVWVEIDEKIQVESDMVTEIPYPKTDKL